MAQKKTVKVLLLGTFHFDNPGLDVAKFKDADILSKKRQAEVQEVNNLLKAFVPDKIFVEWNADKQLQLDSSLSAYKAGKLILGASEVQQLAFRLSRELPNSSIYAVDYNEAEFPWDSLMKSAIDAKQHQLVSYAQRTIEEVQQSFNDSLQKSTIRQLLLWQNSEAMMKFQNEFYFKLLPAGKPGNHIGSYLVSEWWRRNMVIYENILKQLDNKDQRVLVLFGSGHTAILHELMKFNTDIELVPVADILTTAGNK